MHFYDPISFEPRHTVEMSSGKIRPSTSRDAKKNGWKPSVSTVMSVVGDEGILRYEKEQIMDACWMEPFTGGDVKEWKNKIRRLADIKREKAASDGNRIHRELENYFANSSWEQDITDSSQLDIDITTNVSNFLWQEFGNIEWKAEKTFVLDFAGGYGGCVDLHSSEGKGIIIDFKTQATGDVDNFRYYDKYCMQLAAYAYGLGLQEADCYILKVSSTHPGVLQLKKYSKKSINLSFSRFYHLLQYWYITKMGVRALR